MQQHQYTRERCYNITRCGIPSRITRVTKYYPATYPRCFTVIPSVLYAHPKKTGEKKTKTHRRVEKLLTRRWIMFVTLGPLTHFSVGLSTPSKTWPDTYEQNRTKNGKKNEEKNEKKTGGERWYWCQRHQLNRIDKCLVWLIMSTKTLPTNWNSETANGIGVIYRGQQIGILVADGEWYWLWFITVNGACGRITSGHDQSSLLRRPLTYTPQDGRRGASQWISEECQL